MFDILLKNATVITMNDDARVVYSAFIGVTGKSITYFSTVPPTDAAAKSIDCKGNIVMPGFINAHTHTAMTLFRGFADDYSLNDWLFNHVFPAEARCTEEDICAGFTLGIAEMLSFGVTSISDSYFHQPACARIAANVGIRAGLSNAIISLSPSYDFLSDRSVTEVFEMLLDSALPDRVRPEVSIHCERTSSPEVWVKAVELAKRHDLPMQIHLSETRSDHEECVKKYGKTPAEILCEYGVFDMPAIAAHGCYVTESDMDILSSHEVSIAHCPVSNLKLSSGIADVVTMQKHKCNVALGTDGCCSNNNHNLLEEVKLAALLAKQLHGDTAPFKAYDALKTATVNGAFAQRLQSKIGAIKVGMEADVIMLRTDSVHAQPIYDPVSAVVYSLSGHDVCMTMVQGNILYENGEFKTLDLDKAIFDVNRCITKFRK